MRSLASLLLAFVGASCLSGPWPGRPPRFNGEIKKAVEAQDAEILREVQDRRPQRYPMKVYWIGVPDWRPLRSRVGLTIGRYTDEGVVARVVRYDGSRDG